jgi:uncharacterized phage protein gp47/JayE
MVRDSITTSLYGAAFIGNNVLRVMADAMAGLAHHVLRFIDWLALQLLPDTAETEWLDRHGDIWLVNADSTVGRKMATYATGSVNFFGTISGVVIPVGTQLTALTIGYETTVLGVTGLPDQPVPVAARALDPGVISNLNPGDGMALTTLIDGVSGTAAVVTMDGGTDTETDDELRMRVLHRIRQPPQGGSAHDYVQWALAVPGCTRAWCAPLEMGIGTVTVRVLFDDLRADDDGWPTYEDLITVTNYIDSVRPVAVKDFWVLAPVKQPIDIFIRLLTPDTPETRAAIEASLQDMMFNFAAPGQTIFAAWKSYAIMSAVGVASFDLINSTDDLMQSPGNMAVLGDIVYG